MVSEDKRFVLSKVYSTKNYDGVKEVNTLEIIACSNNRDQLLRKKKYLMDQRTKEEQRDKTYYELKPIPKKKETEVYEAWYKQMILAKIPEDLEYAFGDKGTAIASDTVHKLKDEPWSVLTNWSEKRVTILKEEWNESISTYSHVCSRSTTIIAEVDLIDKKVVVKGTIFHEAFRV